MGKVNNLPLLSIWFDALLPANHKGQESVSKYVVIEVMLKNTQEKHEALRE